MAYDNVVVAAVGAVVVSLGAIGYPPALVAGAFLFPYSNISIFVFQALILPPSLCLSLSSLQPAHPTHTLPPPSHVTGGKAQG